MPNEATLVFLMLYSLLSGRIIMTIVAIALSGIHQIAGEKETRQFQTSRDIFPADIMSFYHIFVK